jgi:hypothetical protein
MTAGGFEMCRRRDEWMELIRWTMLEHSKRKGCSWIGTEEDIFNDIADVLERYEICKAAA